MKLNGIGIFAFLEVFHELVSIQILHIFNDILVSRKDTNEAVISVCIRLFESIGITEVEIFLLGAVHFFDRVLIAVEIGEVAVIRVLIFFLPFSLEVKGIYESHHHLLFVCSIKVVVIEKTRYHALCIAADPLVDVLDGVLVKRSLVYLGVVVFLVLFKEFIEYLKCRLVSEPDGICYIELFLVLVREILYIVSHILVELIESHAVSENLLHFSLCVSVSTVCSHSKCR